MDDVKEQIDLMVGDLEEHLEKITTKIDKIKNGKTLNPAREASEVEGDIQHAKDQISQIRLEMPKLKPQDKADARAQVQQFRDAVEDAENELQWASAKQNINASGKSGEKEAKQLTVDEGIAHGEKTWDEIHASKDRTKQMLAQAEEEAKIATETLAEQRHQFEKMIQETYEIEDEMLRARKITRIMLRRVATDKVMWCLMGLIVFGIIGVIAVNI